MKPTAVYLISSDTPGLFKVGLSDCVPRRSHQVSLHYHLGSSVRAEAWLPSRRTAQQAETAWHRFLNPLRADDVKGREWFNLTSELVDQIIDWTKLSPGLMPLKMSLKSGRMTPYQIEQLSTTLLKAIPDGRIKGRSRSPV